MRIIDGRMNRKIQRRVYPPRAGFVSLKTMAPMESTILLGLATGRQTKRPQALIDPKPASALSVLQDCM
ncbi:hypothetical protein [Geosporobacter ferrireducens]|uniref:hypothetical protein n=1 Tax=Geosporobacter ferrireducens TaxID=1424294 RepID=UPI002357020D|nr:hypothetical protein [Geosporobacter ferrireducens]